MGESPCYVALMCLVLHMLCFCLSSVHLFNISSAPTGIYPGLPYALHPPQSSELQQHIPGQVPMQRWDAFLCRLCACSEAIFVSLMHVQWNLCVAFTFMCKCTACSPPTQLGYYTSRQFSAGNSGIDGVPFELAPDLQKQLNAGNRQSNDSVRTCWNAVLRMPFRPLLSRHI